MKTRKRGPVSESTSEIEGPGSSKELVEQDEVVLKTGRRRSKYFPDVHRESSVGDTRESYKYNSGEGDSTAVRHHSKRMSKRHITKETVVPTSSKAPASKRRGADPNKSEHFLADMIPINGACGGFSNLGQGSQHVKSEKGSSASDQYPKRRRNMRNVEAFLPGSAKFQLPKRDAKDRGPNSRRSKYFDADDSSFAGTDGISDRRRSYASELNTKRKTCTSSTRELSDDRGAEPKSRQRQVKRLKKAVIFKERKNVEGRGEMLEISKSERVINGGDSAAVLASSSSSSTSKLRRREKKPKATGKVLRTGQQCDSKTNQEPSAYAGRRPRKVKQKPPVKRSHSPDDEDCSDEWEDVEERLDIIQEDKGTDNKTSVQVAVDRVPGSKELKIAKRWLKRIQRMIEMESLKCYLLCCIAHGRFLSSLCSSSLLRATSLSRLPLIFSNVPVPKRDAKFLDRFANWFRGSFVLKFRERQSEIEEDRGYKLCILDVLRTCEAHRVDDLVLVFLCLARALGLDGRVVLATVPLRSADDLLKKMDSSSATFDRGIKGRNNPDLKSSKTQRTETDAVGGRIVPRGMRMWPEIYLLKEQKWFYVDVLSGGDRSHYGLVSVLPLDFATYVLSVDQNLAVKDLSLKYLSDFSSVKFRTSRVEKKWWAETLSLFKSLDVCRDNLEDFFVREQLLKLPMPSSLGEFKNHPLYVLERDLLKFEALYPKDVKPIASFKGLDVYPREAVCALHTKEKWLNEARTIKDGEEPYKISKARPKLNVPKELRKELPLFLFGYWQTKEYEPPTCANGKVPCNQFGNVELYKMSMLPHGAAYSPIPNLQQVAQKLDIDCVPAVVGWEFHGGSSHPKLEGWVFCKEYEQLLLSEWEKEEAIHEVERAQRRSKRALELWKRFTKGLLIKAQLSAKFASGRGVGAKTPKAEPEAVATKSEPNDDKKRETPAEDSWKTAWPQRFRQFPAEMLE